PEQSKPVTGDVPPYTYLTPRYCSAVEITRAALPRAVLAGYDAEGYPVCRTSTPTPAGAAARPSTSVRPTRNSLEGDGAMAAVGSTKRDMRQRDSPKSSTERPRGSDAPTP